MKRSFDDAKETIYTPSTSFCAQPRLRPLDGAHTRDKLQSQSVPVHDLFPGGRSRESDRYQWALPHAMGETPRPFGRYHGGDERKNFADFLRKSFLVKIFAAALRGLSEGPPGGAT